MEKTFNAEFNFLKEELKQLKSLFELPRIYITNHFSDMRRKVEVAFVMKGQNIDSREARKLLEQDRIKTINLIVSFEQDCLKRQKINTFNNEITTRTLKQIKLIEKKLEEMNRFMLLEHNTDDEDELNQEFQYISGLINEEKIQIEKIIFLNKTLIFLNKYEINEDQEDNLNYFDSDDNNELIDYYKYRLFDRNDLETVVGMIIFVDNEFIGEQGVEFLKK